MNYLFVILIFMSLFLFIILKCKKHPLVLLLLTILALMIYYPSISLNAAKEGINLWLFVVIPSLMPFFILNDMLVCLRVPDNIARVFAPVAKLLFNTSGYGAYVFIMSIFSGYPAGARITAQLIENKKISSKEGLKILTFSSTSGPLFIIGALGAGMFKSTTAGYILFLAHIAGSIINGIVMRIFFQRQREAVQIAKSGDSRIPPIGEMLSKAISSSLVTCGYIGGYIILFSVLISLFNTIGLFKLFTLFMHNLLFIPLGLSEIVSSLFETSLEITNGCKIISLLSVSFDLKLIMSSFIIAFSGLSIIGQAVSIISRTGINLKAYFLSKIGHGIFSAAVCYILLKIGNFSLNVSGSLPSNSLLSAPILLESLLILVLVFNILGTRKYRKNKVL